MTPEQIMRHVISIAKKDHSGLEFVLVGQKAVLERLFDALAVSNLPISFIHADDYIIAEHHPVHSIRTRKRASIRIAAEMVRDKKADALISIGNFSSAVAASRYFLKMIPGIHRPALAVFSPNEIGESVLIDAGANINTTADDLYQFAQMGVIYAKKMLGVQNPKIGLLSIGEEDTKGNELIKETMELFKKQEINFLGNIEGRDIFSNKVDVIVSNGFVGHVAWKVGESLMNNVQQLLAKEINKTIRGRLGKYLAQATFNEIQKKANIDEHGGAPLLGVNGISIIANPSENVLSLQRAVDLAKKCYQSRIMEDLEETFKIKLKETILSGG